MIRPKFQIFPHLPQEKSPSSPFKISLFPSHSLSFPMIPRLLTLKNFLSYQEASLDFQGLHTACICGANGAGKSSLLEAMTWAIWGKCRIPRDLDLIHLGMDFVRVDFEFICNRQTYRVIRSRSRTKNVTLEFQILTPQGTYRSLTRKAIKDTQREIDRELHLDYETFAQSAYLKQGEADNFMQQKPTERKEFLARLLQLDKYDLAAQKARDKARTLKARGEVVTETIADKEVRIAGKGAILAELETLATYLGELRQQQSHHQTQLLQLQQELAQCDTLKQNQTQYHQQLHQQQQLITRYQGEIQQAQQQQQDYQAILDQASTIIQSYEHYRQAQNQENHYRQLFEQYQKLQSQIQQLEQILTTKAHQLDREIDRLENQIQSLQSQEKERQQWIAQAPDIEERFQRWQTVLKALEEQQERQREELPLRQQKETYLRQRQQERDRLTYALEQHQRQAKELRQTLEESARLRQQLIALDQRLSDGDKKRQYHQWLTEKAQEAERERDKGIQQRYLLAQQRDSLEQKIQLLLTPHAACPLCEQPMESEHHHHVQNKLQAEKNQLEQSIFLIEEAIVNQEQLQKKHQREALALVPFLEQHQQEQKEFERLEQTLENLAKLPRELNQLEQEILRLETALQQEDPDPDRREQMGHLEKAIAALGYDEKNHALLMNQEKQLRRVEFERENLKKAQEQSRIYHQQVPEQQQQLAQRIAQRQQLQDQAPECLQKKQLETQIAHLDYHPQNHQEISQWLQTHQGIFAQYQNLQIAQKEAPLITQKIAQLTQDLDQSQGMFQSYHQALESIGEKIEQYHHLQDQIAHQSQKIQALEQTIGEQLIAQGNLQAQAQQIERSETELVTAKQQLQQLQKQYRIYEELSKAFGKNGIQALMIANALPQLEIATNQILGRLTGNQFHVQFITEKEASASTKRNPKMLETLDIQIADSQGTRPYETYSGGEAFRINFAIRLALSQLLTQRSGTALQMLVIDEGFGTQDQEGCERLIAAIQAISQDFACILTVSHMSQLKEAFQNHIEVYKTNQGSQLRLVS